MCQYKYQAAGPYERTGVLYGIPGEVEKVVGCLVTV